MGNTLAAKVRWGHMGNAFAAVAWRAGGEPAKNAGTDRDCKLLTKWLTVLQLCAQYDPIVSPIR